MTTPTDAYDAAIAHALASVRRIADPVRRIAVANELIARGNTTSAALAAVTREAVAELRDRGLTYEAIASRLGVTKARVQQLAR